MGESDEEYVNAAETNEAPANSNHISATLKLPPFWSNRPDLWFLQVETQFRLKNISTSQTKYDHLISSLTPESMEIVADFLINPPLENKYASLKKLLISRCQDTEERRLDSLLHRIDLGDLKPSELYRQMENLAGNNSLINRELLKKLWLNKLPDSIRPCIIAIESTHTNEQVFNIADKIHDSAFGAKIASVNSATSSSKAKNPFESDVENLTGMFEKMLCRIDKLERRNSRYSSRERNLHTSSRGRSDFRSKSRPKYPNTNMCWYHSRYREKAEKCISPCDFNLHSNSKN